MRTHEEFIDDCAAYVLGALPEDEAAALRAHVETCARCRREVDRLGAVAAALGRGVPPVVAPSELRRRVLDVVEAEAALLAAAGRSTAASPRRTRLLRPAYALAAVAALAVGIALGALVIAPGNGPTRVVRAAVAPAVRWHATHAPLASLHESGNHAVLVVSHMPAAPRGKIYEIWVLRSGRPVPTDALFNASSDGDASVGVPSSLHGISAVLVTAERLGGASVPTMTPLITAPLS